MNFLSSDGDGPAFSKNSFGRFGNSPNNADTIAACTGVFLFRIDLIALACHFGHSPWKIRTPLLSFPIVNLSFRAQRDRELCPDPREITPADRYRREWVLVFPAARHPAVRKTDGDGFAARFNGCRRSNISTSSRARDLTRSATTIPRA
jgi:hypothetical protein